MISTDNVVIGERIIQKRGGRRNAGDFSNRQKWQRNIFSTAFALIVAASSLGNEITATKWSLSRKEQNVANVFAEESLVYVFRRIEQTWPEVDAWQACASSCLSLIFKGVERWRRRRWHNANETIHHQQITLRFWLHRTRLLLKGAQGCIPTVQVQPPPTSCWYCQTRSPS